MKKLVIAVDLDSVLNDLSRYWLETYNREHNDTYPIEQLTDWDWHKLLPIGKDIYTYLDRPGFFTNCPPVKPAIAAVRQLVADGHTVIVITACDNAPHVFAEKAAWIDRWLPFLPKKNKIIGGNFKHLFKADVLIDDSAANCLAFRDAWPDSTIVSLRYPHNAHGHSACNFVGVGYTDFEKTWGDIYDYINTKVGRPILHF